jgi:hypothetical protein
MIFVSQEDGRDLDPTGQLAAAAKTAGKWATVAERFAGAGGVHLRLGLLLLYASTSWCSADSDKSRSLTRTSATNHRSSGARACGKQHSCVRRLHEAVLWFAMLQVAAAHC